MGNLAYVAYRTGDFQRTWDLFTENLASSSNSGDRYHVALSLDGLGILLGTLGSITQGGRLLGAGQALLEELGSRYSAADQMEYNRALALIHGQADEAELAAAWAKGQRMGMEQAIEYVLEQTPAW